MGQTYDAIDTATETGAAVFAKLAVRNDTLRSSFSGAVAPLNPVAGQLWLDTSGAQSILKVYADIDGGGADWFEIGSMLHGDLSVGVDSSNPNEIKFVLLENRAAITPAAAQVGRIYQDATTGRFMFVLDASTLHTVLTAGSADMLAVRLPLDAWRSAGGSPTPQTFGTTPAVPGILLDDVGEILSASFIVPAGYSATADGVLRLFVALNVAETANDDINITADLRVVLPDSNEALDGTSTQATGTVDIGANTAQYSVHAVDIVLDYDDANNPIAAGDLVAVAIHLTNTTTIAAVQFLGGMARFPVGSKVTE